MSNLWYPSVKQSPIQGITGYGGGATGLSFGGAAVDKGGSVYYNDNEYLLTSDKSVFDFDQNNSFCVEAFINMYELSRYNYIALRWSGGTSGYKWRYGVDTNNKLFFAGAISAEQSGSSLTSDTWYHVAAVR